MANRLNYGKRYEQDHALFTDPMRFRFVELHQIGELSCEAGYTVEPHMQRVFEITYVVSGKGTVETDGHRYKIEENSVFINAPGQKHTIYADRSTPLHFCYLGFMFIGRHRADIGPERFYRSWNGSTPFSDKSLLVLFLRAIEELSTANDGCEIMVGAYAEQIVMQAYRRFEEQNGNRTLLNEIRSADVALTVKRYIDRHFRDVDDYRELAGQLGYSYTYLAHVFKERMGVTIGGYIIAKKMEEAKWLLRKGRISVSQIAARFNYQSVQSFSNAFKKAVGVSPADYQALPADQIQKYTAVSI